LRGDPSWLAFVSPSGASRSEHLDRKARPLEAWLAQAEEIRTRRDAGDCADFRGIVISAEAHDLTSALATVSVTGKAVFFDHPPLAAETSNSNPRPRQSSHYVGMLSAHDASVSEMETTIRSGAIGDVTGVNALGDEAEPWKQLELLNIALRNKRKCPRQ